MTAHFTPPFRSRKVLDHARGQPCTFRFSVCCRDPETTVACHISDRHKGMGTKASDSSTVFGCWKCHDYLDRGLWMGGMAEADVLRIIIRAMQETTEILIRDGIIGFPHDKQTTFHQKPGKPRLPPQDRAKVAGGRPLQSAKAFPKGRKIGQRNDLRRND